MCQLLIKKNYSNRTSGFALLQVLMLMAALSLTIPILLNTVLDSSKKQQRRSKKQDYMTFVQSMKFKLEDPHECTRLLNGVRVNELRNTFGLNAQQLESRMLAIKTPLTRLNTGYGNFAGPIQIPWDSSITDASGNKLQGQSFTLDEVFVVPTRDETLKRLVTVTDEFGNPIKDPKTGEDKKELKDVGAYGEVKAWGSSAVLKTIPIRVYFVTRDVLVGTNIVGLDGDSGATETLPPIKRPELQISLIANINTSRVIQSCSGINSEAAACQFAGGTYDLRPTVTDIPTTPAWKRQDALETATRLRCKPGDRCLNDIQGLINQSGRCAFPYTKKFVGCFGGRNSQRYLCSWCHKDCLGSSCPVPQDDNGVCP